MEFHVQVRSLDRADRNQRYRTMLVSKNQRAFEVSYGLIELISRIRILRMLETDPIGSLR
jgi:hypothetical protein